MAANRFEFNSFDWIYGAKTRILRCAKPCPDCRCCCFGDFMAEFIHKNRGITSNNPFKFAVSGRFVLLFRQYYG